MKPSGFAGSFSIFVPLGIDFDPTTSKALRRFWKFVLHSPDMKRTVRKYKFCSESLAIHKANDESGTQRKSGDEDSNADRW
jgi:hypothetical protein